MFLTCNMFLSRGSWHADAHDHHERLRNMFVKFVCVKLLPAEQKFWQS